jgi:hypothetical protein
MLAQVAHDEDGPTKRQLTRDSKLGVLSVLDEARHNDNNNNDNRHENLVRYLKKSKEDSVNFEEFLLADKNGDGRVSSSEWEDFLSKKTDIQSHMDSDKPAALNVEIPLSFEDLNRMVAESEGLHVSINGMRYKVQLSAEGKTNEIVTYKTKLLHQELQKLSKMEVEKRPLDKKAARHTKRILTFGLVYLLSQAAVIAKLVRFSSFFCYLYSVDIACIDILFSLWLGRNGTNHLFYYIRNCHNGPDIFSLPQD